MDWLRRHGSWIAAGLLACGLGSVAIARLELARLRGAFDTDIRIAHRLLSQRVVQHDAVLVTLARLQPPAQADPAEQRLPSLSQILRGSGGRCSRNPARCGWRWSRTARPSCCSPGRTAAGADASTSPSTWRRTASRATSSPAASSALANCPGCRCWHGRWPSPACPRHCARGRPSARRGNGPRTIRELARLGANLQLLDADRYDAVTIASVADDEETLRLLLLLGASARLVTSRYDGTALIAAAHLGHDGVVRQLIAAGAPVDHVNNLHWTAAIEAVVLGDGGPRHQRSLQALIGAGANLQLADRQGQTPLALARSRGYRALVRMLEQAGAK